MSNPRSTSPRHSQSTDEGIDRDTGSIFESAHSDYQTESIYAECREDATIINESNRIRNDHNQFQWRNRPRPQWNSKKVKHSEKKSINPNKPPLPAEKRKNSRFK